MTLKKYIQQDQVEYCASFSKAYFLDWLLKSESFWIRRYLTALRSEEYFLFVRPRKIRAFYYRRRRNKLAAKLGIIIHPGNFEAGLKLWHYGSMIVHPDARIGKNCTIHGNCCIGSNGGFPDLAPTIGDNVDIGQNAQIIGGIQIADNVKIGAGAVVVKSILTPGVTVVGIPAHIVNKE